MVLRSEESGQWLENVDPTHLVLACGKLVLQKRFYNCLGLRAACAVNFFCWSTKNVGSLLVGLWP